MTRRVEVTVSAVVAVGLVLAFRRMLVLASLPKFAFVGQKVRADHDCPRIVMPRHRGADGGLVV